MNIWYTSKYSNKDSKENDEYKDFNVSDTAYLQISVENEGFGQVVIVT